MSSKRSRVVRSSSTGEFGLLNLLKPKKSPVAQSEKKRATAAPVSYPKPIPKLAQKENLKPKVPVKVSEQPRRSIFSLGSPVREKGRIGNGSGRKIGERCFHCKKEIAENEDVFMYGYLQAFCSPECRDEQIALDSKNRKPSPEPPPAAAVTKLKKEPAKGLFGSQVKKYTIAKFK